MQLYLEKKVGEIIESSSKVDKTIYTSPIRIEYKWLLLGSQTRNTIITHES